MQKRGVDFLISVVLVIAITIILAIGILVWNNNFARDIIESAESNTQDTLNILNNAKVKIINVRYDDSEPPIDTSQGIWFTVENKGKLPIVSLIVRVTKPDGTMVSETRTTDFNDELIYIGMLELKELDLSINNELIIDYDSIEVIPIIEDQDGKKLTGSEGSDVWDRPPVNA